MEPGAQALGMAYAKAGRREDAERIAAILPRMASKAQVFAALGDKDRTFGILDEMTPMGPARMGRDFLLSPNFAFLRDDPRVRMLPQRSDCRTRRVVDAANCCELKQQTWKALPSGGHGFVEM